MIFANVAGNGRVQLLGICLPHDVVLVVANVYGWTGGHQNNLARTRTNDFMSAILHEFAHMPSGPKMIVGDLNCEPQDLPALATYLADGEFVDLGSIAHVYGHPPNQPTCYPYNNGTPSRRDYAFASSTLLPLISSLFVGPQGDFPAHGCLHLQLTIPHEGLKKTVLTRPDMTMAERFEAAVQTVCDQQQCDRGSQAAKTIRQQASQKLRESIANRLTQYGDSLHNHIRRRDTSATWGLWSRAVVGGFAEGLPPAAKVPSCATISTKVDHRGTYAMYGR